MKTFTSLLAVFAYISINVNYAQSFYKNYGESGTAISFSMIFDENSNISMIPTLGYSINGQLDFGVRFGVNMLDKNKYIESNSSYDITPYFLVTFFKQGDGKMPISVLTGIGYKYGKISTDFNPSGNLEITTNYVVVSYGLYRDFNIDKNVRIQPRFIFELAMGEAKYSNPELIKLTNSSAENSPQYFEISLPFIYSPTEKTDYFISPLIAFSGGITLFGLFFGVSF